MNDTFQDIPLGQLTPSPTNPRKHFDEAKLQELADSIAIQGVLQPIVVAKTQYAREVNGPEGYEIVAGERRWRAAQLAWLGVIPCRVAELTQQQIVEIQAVENLQREDLDPIEEARGYQHMLDLRSEDGAPVYSHSTLAKRLGLNQTTVSRALQLLSLPAPTQGLVEAGKLSKRTAQLIARIPGAPERAKAAEEISNDIIGKGPMSYREAERYIHDYYVLSLRGAPFDPDDAGLCPAAGSCADCLKRSGNCREEYPDLKRDDLCLDPGCFREKEALANDRLAATAKEAGAQLLDGGEVFQAWGDQPELKYDSPYVLINQKPLPDLLAEDVNPRELHCWRVLAKGRDLPIYLARHPKSGQVRELAEFSVALAAAVENGHGGLFRPEVTRRHEASRAAVAGPDGVKPALPEAKAPAADQRERAKAKAEQARRKRVSRMAFKELLTAVTLRIDPAEYATMEQQAEIGYGDPVWAPSFWESLLWRLEYLANHETMRFVADWYELGAGDAISQVREHINQTDCEGHPELALGLLFGALVADGSAADDLSFRVMLQAYGLDLAEIRREVEDAMAEEAKAKKRASKAKGGSREDAKARSQGAAKKAARKATKKQA